MVLLLQKRRRKRKQKRTAELIQLSKDAELRMKLATVDRSEHFNNTLRQHYSMWKREHHNRDRDSTLKLMKDQIIMATVYASIASSKKNLDLAKHLMKHIKQNQDAIKEANSDAELQQKYFISQLFLYDIIPFVNPTLM